MANKKPFLVAACCRSGTQTLTKTLQAHNLDVKHEHIGRDGCVTGIINWPGKLPVVDRALDIECFDPARIVLVVRHPLRVLESLMIEPYKTTRLVMNNARVYPQSPDPLAWYCAAWYWFNERVLKYSKAVYKLENLNKDLNIWADFLATITLGKKSREIQPIDIMKTSDFMPMPSRFKTFGTKPDDWKKRFPRPALTWADLRAIGKPGVLVENQAKEIFGYD